jgi:hypothetical protein
MLIRSIGIFVLGRPTSVKVNILIRSMGPIGIFVLGRPTPVKVNMLIRSMGPISEAEMVKHFLKFSID